MFKMRKDLILAMLGTFCLTVTLFTIIPIRSQTTPEYDPWKDITDDGYIGIDDIVSVAESFGGLGDPTKNVTVTNWPETLNVNVTNWQQSEILGKQAGWLKYIGQHALLRNALLPQEIGNVSPYRSLNYSLPIGTHSVSHTYYTHGKVDLNIPKGKEIIAKITLSSGGTILNLKNITFIVGYTDFTSYTVLVRSSWTIPAHITPTPSGYTIPLGSLDTDFRIPHKYLYFKVYLEVLFDLDYETLVYWARSDTSDICLLIPY